MMATRPRHREVFPLHHEVGPMLAAREVAELLGCSPSTVYRMVRRGEFPEPASGSGGMTRWTSDQYRAWYAARSK